MFDGSQVLLEKFLHDLHCEDQDLRQTQSIAGFASGGNDASGNAACVMAEDPKQEPLMTRTRMPDSPTLTPGPAPTPEPSRRLYTTQGKIFPPDSPVDVPNLPAAQAPGDGAGTRENTTPDEDASTESSWADNTRVAPAKKNVRNSNIF
jgi:hypothetical protein